MATDGNYDQRSCIDLSQIGLRGNQKPAEFDWDVQHVSESEKKRKDSECDNKFK